MIERLSREICYECKKKILVASYEPHAKAKEVTGIHLEYIDEEGQGRHLGWLCWNCANNYEKKYPELNVMFGFTGHPLCPPTCQIWHKKQ